MHFLLYKPGLPLPLLQGLNSTKELCIGNNLTKSKHVSDTWAVIWVEEITGDDHVLVKFRVYKRIPCCGVHQQNKYDWVEVNDWGDQLFFLSIDCSFSFSAQYSKGCHGNCIVYVDEITDIELFLIKERYEEDNDNDELWELKNGKVGLFNLADQSSGPLELFPKYLAMFWPPPTWLTMDRGSSSS